MELSTTWSWLSSEDSLSFWRVKRCLVESSHGSSELFYTKTVFIAT
jgi:hypothetical protein